MNEGKLREIIDLAEDQHYIREMLSELGLCAFVANGSILPRESGISAKPMRGGVKFISSKEQEVTLELPHKGKLTGMGIKKRNYPDRWRRLSWKVDTFESVGTGSV